MVYSFALFKHANIRYREAVCRLARCELAAMLQSLSIHTDLSEEMMGGSLFLTFECRELTPSELQYLSRHSSVVLMAEKQKDLLRPLPVSPAFYLPEDGFIGTTFLIRICNGFQGDNHIGYGRRLLKKYGVDVLVPGE